jgi:hypothetical protein
VIGIIQEREGDLVNQADLRYSFAILLIVIFCNPEVLFQANISCQNGACVDIDHILMCGKGLLLGSSLLSWTEYYIV